MNAVKSLFQRISWQKTLAVVLIAAGLLFTLLFGFRAVRSVLRLRQHGMRPPMNAIEEIRDWMTIPHIARGNDVPAEYLFDALGIPPNGNGKKSLMDIDRMLGKDPGTTQKIVKEAIQRFQAEHPPKEPPPGMRPPRVIPTAAP